MPEQTTNPLLEQLRDIHSPAEIGVWPPAIGWWILALIIALIFYRLTQRWIRRHRQNRYRKQAVSELDQQFTQWQKDGDCAHYLQSVHALIGRVCLHIEDGQQLSTQTGQQWANDINRYSSEQLDDQSIFALTHAAYQKDPVIELEPLHKKVRQWIKHHQRTPLKSAKHTAHQVSERGSDYA